MSNDLISKKEVLNLMDNIKDLNRSVCGRVIVLRITLKRLQKLMILMTVELLKAREND